MKMLKKIAAISLVTMCFLSNSVFAEVKEINTATRVRKEATTDSRIVKLVSIGDKITVIGESGDWYKVKVDDVTGYIRKDLLDLDEDYPSNNGSQNEEPENNDKPTENGNSNEAGNGNENSEENAGQGQEGNGGSNNQGGNSQENNPDENQNGGQGENNQDENQNGGQGENNSDPENENTENPSQNQGTPMGEDKTISTITLNEQEKEVGAKKNLPNDVKLKILPLANSNNILSVTANTEVTIVEIMNSWCRVETAEGKSGWIRIDQ